MDDNSLSIAAIDLIYHCCEAAKVSSYIAFGML